MIRYILVLFSIISVHSINAQNEIKNTKSEEPTYIRSTIYYPFSNATFEKVELLKYEVEQLKFVKKVKSEFKEEKSAGQLIVILEHRIYYDEEEHPGFDAKKLKELITAKGFIPGNIKVDNTTFKH